MTLMSSNKRQKKQLVRFSFISGHKRRKESFEKEYYSPYSLFSSLISNYIFRNFLNYIYIYKFIECIQSLCLYHLEYCMSYGNLNESIETYLESLYQAIVTHSCKVRDKKVLKRNKSGVSICLIWTSSFLLLNSSLISSLTIHCHTITSTLISITIIEITPTKNQLIINYRITITMKLEILFRCYHELKYPPVMDSKFCSRILVVLFYLNIAQVEAFSLVKLLKYEALGHFIAFLCTFESF
eukprot:gene7715-5414_t